MAETLPSQPRDSALPTLRTQRKRIAITDLMQGAREVILLHAGAEYVLRITKTGKLILTK